MSVKVASNPRLSSRRMRWKEKLERFLVKIKLKSEIKFEESIISFFTKDGWKFFILDNYSGTQDEFHFRLKQELKHYYLKIDRSPKHFIFESVMSIDRKKHLVFIKPIGVNPTFET